MELNRKKKQPYEKSVSNFNLNKIRHNLGLTHYYFGDGKGKTTTLIGLIIRALGHGLKTLLIQFLKKHENGNNEDGFFMGEINFLQELIEIRQFGNGHFITPGNEKNRYIHKILAERGYEFAKAKIMSEEYDLVALDEIVNAISMDLLNLDDLIFLIKNKPDHVELVYTGVMFYRKLREASDYVVGFNSMNHPYENGIMARKGIDF